LLLFYLYYVFFSPVREACDMRALARVSFL